MNCCYYDWLESVSAQPASVQCLAQGHSDIKDLFDIEVSSGNHHYVMFD